MTRSRRVIAVLAVSMALCADSAASAAPAPKMPVAEMAARLAVRLSESFSYATATESRIETRHAAPPQVMPAERVVRLAQPVPQAIPLSPFQFRLPPPLI
jgi:hypothetical protein